MGTRAVGLGSAGGAGVVGEAGLAGVPRLLEDLTRLSEDNESADIVFLLGRDETPVYGHRIILQVRCKNFTTPKRMGTSGNPTPIRMPHAHPETFRQFIHYVYTGKIMLQDSGIFEMLALAQELGVEELWRSCEEHVSATLSPGNACALLTAALDAQDRVLVKTPAFSNLPKDALVKLISSDYLGLEEEDVWRAVLNWAKYQAGVTQPTQHWTEEERARVCQHLAGVINHVRLLLIDSHVFAEEVEPTGAVPIELSLERYRYAAVPNKYSEICADKRLQPRIGPLLFPGSQILSRDKMGYQRLLNQWYGNPKQNWRLIYRASSNGYSASAFHRHCDGVAPTYTIALSSRGEICGGFSDVAWDKTSAKGHYISAEKAFLFTLTNNQDVPPTKYDLIKKPFAICYHPDIGPIFGAGADLLISNNCNVNLESYSNLPHTYDGENASSTILMGDYHFTVLDYEVFTLNGPISKSERH
ncbi:Similar to BTBD19: BTB/POZ domain-containing protein 19 (Homo sapiens) [Cotesia congregata]|uniref:Similar to BTBD19: BTB/POZ domain-containing protein 19 (Homo sapiens) n=1 Tax=Cotesia congregata TaxID=51543 RepID=A0A8J2MPY7_COTCN|nr:Similar to BTBD19: BTB/POZ domain-containing protein 19 (Homo sapiens) [Cotesia congregata]